MKRLGELSGMDVEEIEREAEQKRIARGEKTCGASTWRSHAEHSHDDAAVIWQLQ